MSILSSTLLLTPSVSVSSSSLLNNNGRRRKQQRSKSKSFLMVSSSIIVSIIYILTTKSFVATTDAFMSSSTSQIRSQRHSTIIPSSSMRRAKTTKTVSSTTRATRLGIAKSGGKMIETEKEFADNVLSTDLSRPVLVFFSAPWCGPCRLTVPVVKDVMKQYSGELDVVEICTDELAEVAEESGVVSIPTIQFYYDGAALETHSIVGCVAKSVLSNAIDKVIEDVAQINKINNRL